MLFCTILIRNTPTTIKRGDDKAINISPVNLRDFKEDPYQTPEIFMGSGSVTL